MATTYEPGVRKIQIDSADGQAYHQQMMSEGIKTKQILRKSGLILREFADDHLCFDPTGAEILGLNSVAFRVLKLSDGNRTVEEIAAAIAAEYEVEKAVALADVIDFVASAQADDLLTMI